ncbi:hypothetical protein OAV62_01940 [bacterium]|nr:hypothetical protein [bacterium]
MTDDEMVNAKITCREMIHARNYKLCREDNNLFIATYYEGKRKQLVYIYFVDNPTLTIKIAKYYYYLIEKNKITHCILIYHKAITPTARSGLKSFYDIRIELFKVAELQFNITKHILVPTHLKVSKEAGKDYSKFPSIKSIDPVSRFYGFQNGELIKIIRGDESIAFRIVR